MKILVIGSGGREHALVWALRRSPQVRELYSATSNAGIAKATIPARVDAGDLDSVADFAAREQIDLVVVGPEQPLVDGLVDRLAARGVPAFGPERAAARLEGSKVFAKEFMARHRIPTARSRIAETAEAAIQIVREGSIPFPLVIKADGLAAGKGVILVEDEGQARQAVE